MKKISLYILAAAVTAVLFSPLGVSADKVTYGTVKADALNIRALPNTECAILGQIPNGGRLVITSTSNNWHKIEYGTVSGYVCADYVILGETVEVAPKDTAVPAAPAQNSIIGTAAQQTLVGAAASANTDKSVLPKVESDIPVYSPFTLDKGEQVVELAKKYIGTPYVYGGSTPAGFDCSGFVKYCYSLMGVEINRIAADQAKNGTEIAPADIKPGDILCFASSEGGSYIGHTGIYVGNGYFIHSPRTGYNVEIVPLTYGSYDKRIANIRRIFN